MPLLNIEPPPFQSDLITGKTMSAAWADWILLALLERVQASSPVTVSVELSEQSASIGTTTLIPLAQAGVYRVSWYLRITTVAGVSSSIEVAFHSVDGGLAITQSGAAVTGNTTQTVQSGSFLLRADTLTPISYSTTYASSPAAAMEYSLDIAVESL